MAERRMFAKSIIDSDAFLDMPLSTQALYFHLSMRADDDGFVGNPKRIKGMIGASEDDLKLLIAKRFLLGFDSGVVVVKHWWMHNYLHKDRYKETNYIYEKSQLYLTQTKAYTEKNIDCEQNVNGMLTECKQNDNKLLTQVSIGKDSIDKVSIYKKESIKEKAEDGEINSPTPTPKHKYGKYKNVLLTEAEYERLIAEVDGIEAIEFFSEYRERKGYKCKSDNLSIRKWAFNAVKEERQKKNNTTYPQKQEAEYIEDGDYLIFPNGTRLHKGTYEGWKALSKGN